MKINGRCNSPSHRFWKTLRFQRESSPMTVLQQPCLLWYISLITVPLSATIVTRHLNRYVLTAYELMQILSENSPESPFWSDMELAKGFSACMNFYQDTATMCTVCMSVWHSCIYVSGMRLSQSIKIPTHCSNSLIVHVLLTWDDIRNGSILWVTYRPPFRLAMPNCCLNWIGLAASSFIMDWSGSDVVKISLPLLNHFGKNWSAVLLSIFPTNLAL